MKNLFREHSYSIVKMFINQIAIGIFGAMLSMATAAASSNTLSLVVSIFAVIFYLFLIYTMTWEIGAKDKIAIDHKSKRKNVHTGLILSLIANIPNFLIAIVYSAIFPFMGTKQWAGNINTIIKILSLVIEGMYSGITSVITLSVGGAVYPLHYFWWSYFLITIPALVTSWIAYGAGLRNTRFGAIFVGPKKEKQK